MPAGYSGTYGVNGVALTLQPTSGQWEAKSSLGFDGNGHPIYPPMGEFTLSWDLISTNDFKQLNDFYESVSNTGTVTTELPKWGDVDYLFYSYSGTVWQRPTAGEYFMRYVTGVKMTVSRIRV
jgi:hypothetical protein